MSRELKKDLATLAAIPVLRILLEQMATWWWLACKARDSIGATG